MLYVFVSETAPSESTSVRYNAIPGGDLPGLHDYRCRYSIARSGCTVTVFDRQEAEQLCDFDPDCRAFVLSNRTSWTGWSLFFFCFCF
jgi:extracellular tyrosine-protein kinase PKDCC&